jgi:radical SAM-linked protein
MRKEAYPIDICEKPILVMLKFRVSEKMRYLSHAETLRVFQRACSRAGIDLVYSSGFNPRPKISLPLPRTVGLACDDETCCLRLNHPADGLDIENLKDQLADQMPAGIELFTVELPEQSVSFETGTAIYELPVKSELFSEQLQERVNGLLATDSLMLSRQPHDRKKARTVDVREFIISIELQKPKVFVTTSFGPAGSIRVDEFLNLLQLDLNALAGPVKRTKVLFKSMLNQQQSPVGNN